jgi:outer membrane immunogenic protein
VSVRKSLALAIAAAGAAGFGNQAHAQLAAGIPQWAGPYVGITGGGGWGHQSQSGGILQLPGTTGPTGPTCAAGSVLTTINGVTVCSSTFVDTDGSYNLSGGLIGGAVGYNYQQDRWVLGVEADDSWADITGSGTCGFNSAVPHACGGGIRWLATVRGRLGYDVGQIFPGVGTTLVYAAGGLAVGDVHAWDSLFGTSGDKTATGWTIGAGFETKLNPNWSVKLEYLHVDLGNPAVFSAIPPQPEHVSTTADIFRVGLSYYFSAPPPPPSPVVTKAPPISK